MRRNKRIKLRIDDLVSWAGHTTYYLVISGEYWKLSGRTVTILDRQTFREFEVPVRELTFKTAETWKGSK